MENDIISILCERIVTETKIRGVPVVLVVTESEAREFVKASVETCSPHSKMMFQDLSIHPDFIERFNFGVFLKGVQLKIIVPQPYENRDILVFCNTKWRHTNGCEYVVIGLANEFSTNKEKYPTTVIYMGLENKRLWSRPLSDWHRSMTFIPQTDQENE